MRSLALGALSVIALGCSTAIMAQPADGPVPAKPSTEEILRSNTVQIIRGPDGGFSGPGWDRILADARQAQFTLIGEQHAAADLADFETSVWRAIAPFGYTHAALEVGPFSTDFAERLVRSRKGALGEYIAAPGQGFTLPFLFFAEETAMAEEIVARSPDGQQTLWGLDQEFVGAMPILAQLLADHSETARQRECATRLAEQAKGNAMLLPRLTAADLDELSEVFAGNRAATDIVNAIRTSHAIYQPFVARVGAIHPANLRRETYMKDQFLRQFTAAEGRLGRPPKVFLKFGGYHAMRGMSGTDVPALGNFLAEWGHSRGFGLLNVLADCVNGEVIDPRSGETAPCQPYVGENSALHRLAAASPDSVVLIDLKALRSRLGAMKDLDGGSRQTILAFDYYVALKNVRAATLLAPIAKP